MVTLSLTPMHDKRMNLQEAGASNAILWPYQAFQTKYDVATAEAPRTARRRAGRAEAAGREAVCSERLSDAVARVRNMSVAGRRGGGKARVEEERSGQTTRSVSTTRRAPRAAGPANSLTQSQSRLGTLLYQRPAPVRGNPTQGVMCDQARSCHTSASSSRAFDAEIGRAHV